MHQFEIPAITSAAAAVRPCGGPNRRRNVRAAPPSGSPLPTPATIAATALALVLLLLQPPPASAACSATATPQGVLNASMGVIKSDRDGYGSAKYTRGDNCRWTVECPAGTTFALLDVDLHVYYTFSKKLDYLRVIDANNGVTLESYNTIVSNRRLISDATRVFVDFNTSTQSAPTQKGFTLKYGCVPPKCTAGASNGNFTGGMTFTDRSGKIVSDTNGYSSAFVLEELIIPGEVCNFAIACAFKYVTMWIRHSIWGGSKLTVNGVVYASDSTGQKQEYVDLTALANNSVSIGYVGSPSATSYGFDIAYTCSDSKCSSVTGGSTLTAESGSFGTDADGSGATYKHASEETCNWGVTCPSASNGYLFYSVVGRIGTNSQLTLKTMPAAATQYTQTTTTSSLAIQQSGIVDLQAGGQQTLAVDFSAAASAPSDGWTVSYACRGTKCTANSAGQTLTAASGTLRSDSDGAGSSGTVYAGEECAWRIECPAEFTGGLAVSMYGNTGSAAVSVTPDSGAGFSGAISGTQSNPTSQFFSSGSANVSFASGGSSNDGFTLQWICLRQSQCTSANASTAGVGAAKGTIVSDADGAGTEYYFAKGEDCAWQIQCPAAIGASFIRLTTSGYASSGGSGFGISVMNLAESVTHISTFSDTCCRDKPQFVAASSALVKFTSDAASTALQRGFAVEWACTANRCPVDDNVTLTSVSGELTTDGDGAGTAFKYQLNDKCRWRIECPAGHNYTYVKVTPNTASCTTDKLTVVNERTGVADVVACGTTTKTTVMHTGSVAVQWDVAGSVSDGGAKLEWQCREREYPCSLGNESDATADRGQLVSDTDGHSRTTRQPADEKCQRRIVCPAGFTHIAMKVRYSLGSGAKLVVGTKTYTDSSTSGRTAALRLTGATATVLLDTTASSAAVGGYTIDYQCQAQPCLSLSPQHQTAATGSIRSDLDGRDASFHYNNGDKCEWIARCPADRGYRYMYLTGYAEMASGGADRWDIRDATTYSRIEDGRWTYERIDEQVKATGVRVTLNTTSTSNADGLTVDWVCSESLCRASSAGATFTNPAGVQLKHDTNPSNAVGEPEACFWRLVCGAGERVYFTDGTGDVGANRVVVYANSDGASALDPARMAQLVVLSGKVSLPRFYLNASDVFVAYNYTEPADGFQLRAYCDSKPGCDGTLTPAAVAGGATVYESDTDGAGKSGVLDNSGTCLVAVTCPAETPVARLTATYDLRSSGVRLFGPLDASVPEMTSAYFQSIGNTTLLLATPASVQIHDLGAAFSNIYTRANNWGVTVNYTCESGCSTSMATKQLASCASLSGATGCSVTRLETDADGQGRGAFERGETCKWPVQCPIGQHAALRTLAAPDVSANTFVVHATDGGASTSSSLSRYSAHGAWYISDTNAATAQFVGVEANSTGLVTEARCRPSQCDADETTRTDTTGTIYFGGNSTGSYSMNARCAFEIKCPAGSGSTRFVCGGGARSSLDRVYFDTMNGSDVAQTGVYKIASTAMSFVTTDAATHWRVRFESTVSTSTRDVVGARCIYTCIGATPTPSAAPGGIVSAAPGSPGSSPSAPSSGSPGSPPAPGTPGAPGTPPASPGSPPPPGSPGSFSLGGGSGAASNDASTKESMAVFAALLAVGLALMIGSAVAVAMLTRAKLQSSADGSNVKSGPPTAATAVDVDEGEEMDGAAEDAAAGHVQQPFGNSSTSQTGGPY